MEAIITVAGRLMFLETLTWQAVAFLVVFLVAASAFALWLVGKALSSLAVGIGAIRRALR